MPYKNPEYQALHNRKSEYRRKYGITIEDYDRMLEEQNGRCAICRTDKPGGAGARFAVDHNHDTGNVRGLLCNNCNRGLGHLKDSVLLLEQAINYLNEEKGN